MGLFGRYLMPKEIKDLKKSHDVEGLIRIVEWGDKNRSKHAVNALRDLDCKTTIETRIFQILGRAKSSDDDAIDTTLNTITRFGDLAFIPLIKALDNPNEDIEKLCYTALIKIHLSNKKSIDELEEAFKDKSIIKNTAKFISVVSLYMSQNEPSLINSAIGFFEPFIEDNIEIFKELTKDSHPRVMAGALLLIVRVTDDKKMATELVKKNFEDDSLDIETRKSIYLGLLSLGNTGEEIIEQLSFRRTAEVVEAISQSPEYQEQLQEQLLEELSSGNEKERWSAAIYLAEQGNPKSIEVLTEMINHGDARTRKKVVRCLKEIKDDRITNLVLKVLKDGNLEVRKEGVEVISELQVRNKEDKEILIKHLLDIIRNSKENEDLRKHAVLAVHPKNSNITKDIRDKETIIMILKALKTAEKDESESIKPYAGLISSYYLNIIKDEGLEIPTKEYFDD